MATPQTEGNGTGNGNGRARGPGGVPPITAAGAASDSLVELRPNPEASRLDSRSSRRGGPAARGRPRGRLYTPRRIETVDRLDDEGMLPAIYFIFSRAGCDQAVDACLAAGMRLTEAEERAQITEIADIALRKGDQAGKKAAEVAAIGDRNYADWQREFLSLTGEE